MLEAAYWKTRKSLRVDRTEEAFGSYSIGLTDLAMAAGRMYAAYAALPVEMRLRRGLEPIDQPTIIADLPEEWTTALAIHLASARRPGWTHTGMSLLGYYFSLAELVSLLNDLGVHYAIHSDEPYVLNYLIIQPRKADHVQP